MSKVVVEYKFWWWVVGTSVSAISLISLLQKVFGFGLSSVFREFITYYRKVFHFPFELLAAVLPVHVPDWYKDAFVLSFIMLSAHLRADAAEGRLRFDSRFTRIMTSVAFPLLLSIPLLGLLTFLVMLSIVVSRPAALGDDRERVDSAVRASRYEAISLFCVAVAVIVFFVLNSQM